MKKGLLKFSALALSLLFVVTGCQKHQHQWSTEYEHDNDKHWQTCASCDEHNNEGAHTFTERVTTPATHTATGVKTYTCSVCGFEKTEVIQKTTEHSYTILRHNDDTHWYECECGEKQAAVEHTWGAIEVVVPATYEAAGSGKYTCTVCGAEKSVVIDQLTAPETGAKGHEISVSRALELLAAETVESGATTANEYYVEGIITYAKKSTKEEAINDFNMDVADPADPSKKIQSYYAVTAADVDVSKIVVGNKVRVGGLITNFRGTTWEWTSTGSVYYVEELSHEVTLGAHEHATVNGLEATYVSGATVTFNVVADEGYGIKQVLVDGKGVTGADGVYSFVMGNGATIVVETEESNVSLVPAGETVEQVLGFSSNFGTYAADWTNTYGTHSMTLSDLGSTKFAGSVEIVGCNKQGSTITTMPVLNGKNTTVTIAVNKYAIREAEFNLSMWNASKKFNDIHIEASTDGVNFVAVSENAIEAGSPIPAEGLKVSAKLAKDVISVRLVVVSSATGSNVQTGLADATIKLGNLNEELVHTHSATHVPAVAAGCEAAGNIEYWYCAECGKYFSDEALTNEITLDATVVAAKGHTLVKVEAKDPTYLEAGNIAHYKCSECGKTFADENGLEPLADVAIAALGIKPTATADTFVKVSYNSAPVDVYPSVRLIEEGNQNWNGSGFALRIKNLTGIDTPLDMQINDVAGNRNFLVATDHAPYFIDLDGNWSRGTLTRAWGNYVMIPANFDGWIYVDYAETVNRTDFGSAFDKTINVWGLFVIINPHYDAYSVMEYGAIQVLRDGRFVTVLDPKADCCDEWSFKVRKDYEAEFINFDYLGEHNYVHHDAVEATYTETGMAEYYECSNCHWYFNADKQPVAYDSLITPVKENPVATSDMLIYDLTGKVTADLQDDVEVVKWDYNANTWASTSASVLKGKNLKDEDAIVLKAWNNDLLFRYSFPYSTNKYYKSVKFSAVADGVVTMKVQLMNSTEGYYTTYNLGKLYGGNCDYTIALTDGAWVITYGEYKVSFAQAKAAGYINYNDETEMVPQFDLVNLLITGHTENGADTNVILTDLRFGFEGDTTVLVPHEVPNANVVLDFSDGAGSDKYKGANWYERVYTDKWSDWGAVTQMNSRSLNGDKNANAYCDTMTRQYAYNPAEEIGNVKYVEAKLGNYWSNSAAGTIKIKVSLIDVKGATHYLLGGASGSTNEWYLLENVTSPQAYAIQAKVDLPETIEVDYFVITTKMASGQAYLYMDDIKLLAENPTPIVVTYEPIDFTEDFESYGSLPANVNQTVSNIYFKNVAGAGADGSAKYLSVYTRGGNGMVYTLSNPGKADKVTVTMKNDFASYKVDTDVQIDVIGLDGAVVGAKKVTLTAGQAWTAFEVELTEAQSVVTKVICTFSPQGATADCYCYVDNIIVK